MNEHNVFKEDTLKLMREVDRDPSVNQRTLSQKLDISLGKTNYLLKELIKKGIVKVTNFSKKPDKAKKIKYILTQRGIEQQVNLTFHFLKAREKEYKRLKNEYEAHIKNLNRNKTNGGKNA